MITSETFSAIHLRSIELNEDTAKNCKIRSKFMHETIVECKNVNGGDSINISIGNHGMDILSQNNVFLESHPISQVSYSVCDRSSHQFAIVSRQQLPPHHTDNHMPPQQQHVQMCHVFRLNSPAEADSVNRHFGSLFKQLHEEKRKAKRAGLNNNNHDSSQNIVIEPIQQNHNAHSQVSNSNNINMRQNTATPTGNATNSNVRPETRSDLPRRRSNNPARRTVYGDVATDEDWEKKLRRISSPLIEELISAASNNVSGNPEPGLIRSGSGSNNTGKNGPRLRSGGVTAGGVEAVTRRLSLCLMPTNNNNAIGGLPQQQSEEGVEDFEDNEPIHDLVGISGVGGGARKRRNNGSNEGSSNGSKNRISAVFERFSFRTSSVGAGSSGNNGGLGGGSGRASRDVSTDCLKSGSPVVLLKERIESGIITPPELNRQSKSIHNSNNHQDEVKFHQNAPSQFITNKPVVSNNSNIGYVQPPSQLLQDCDEIAPEPPVRIHSLRQGTNQISTPINNNTSHPIKTTGDVDLSPITTPSSSSDSEEIDDNQPHHQSQQQQQQQLPPQRHHYHQHQPQPQPQAHRNFNKPTSQDNYPSQQILTNNNIPPPLYTPNNVAGSNCGGASMVSIDYTNYYFNLSKDQAKEYLLERAIGDFVIRDSASQPRCLALSVKVGPSSVSHYIIANCHKTGGFRIVGCDKSWPNLNNLITHLSVIPELLPCPLLLNIEPIDCNSNNQLPNTAGNPVNLQQYQQLSEFSSIVASLDLR